MRINYLVPGPMGRSPEGKAELARRGSLLRQYAAPGTEVGIDDVPEGPASIESMYEEYLSIPAAARRAVELEDNGWDALILGCYGDPGLDALRELLMIPIIGPGEATALMAASLGHRFSIITVTESVIASTERQIRNVGVGEKLASVRVVGIPVLELHHDRERSIEATIEQGRKAIEQYASKGFEQIKIYSSVKPELVPTLVRLAHEKGLRLSGHVPAFMTARQFVEAGADEIQHINMLVLNFLFDKVQDTRTPQRFIAVGENAATLAPAR